MFGATARSRVRLRSVSMVSVNRTAIAHTASGRWLRRAWAAPTTLVGLLLGGLALVTGGGVRREAEALEFHGGALRLIPKLTPVHAKAMAIGHAIVAVDERTLHAYRDHEMIHVRQAERWGPLFLPAYLAASGWAWLRGGHFYLDNWFEADARRHAPHVVPENRS